MEQPALTTNQPPIPVVSDRRDPDLADQPDNIPPIPPGAADRVAQFARPSPRVIMPSWLDLFDPRQPEAFLAFCSGWCSLQMWLWPNQFANANALISFNIGLRGHEQVWAIFGGIAALLKLIGLACRLYPRWQAFSDGFRESGLFMSVVFWLIVGLSRMIDFPHLITPVALTGLGIAAAFELAGRHDPRGTWR